MGNECSLNEEVHSAEFQSILDAFPRKTQVHKNAAFYYNPQNPGEGILVKSVEESQSMERELFAKRKLHHENLLRVLGFSSNESDLIGFCGVEETQRYLVALEHCSRTLRDDIERRRVSKEAYSERDIRALFKSLVKAGCALDSIGLNHRAILPGNVHLTRNGKVVLGDDLSVDARRDLPRPSFSENLKSIALTVIGAATLLDSIEVGRHTEHQSLDKMREMGFSSELLSLIEKCLFRERHYSFSREEIEREASFLMEESPPKYQPKLEEKELKAPIPVWTNTKDDWMDLMRSHIAMTAKPAEIWSYGRSSYHSPLRESIPGTMRQSSHCLDRFGNPIESSGSSSSIGLRNNLNYPVPFRSSKPF